MYIHMMKYIYILESMYVYMYSICTYNIHTVSTVLL